MSSLAGTVNSELVTRMLTFDWKLLAQLDDATLSSFLRMHCRQIPSGVCADWICAADTPPRVRAALASHCSFEQPDECRAILVRAAEAGWLSVVTSMCKRSTVWCAGIQEALSAASTPQILEALFATNNLNMAWLRSQFDTELNRAVRSLKAGHASSWLHHVQGAQVDWKRLRDSITSLVVLQVAPTEDAAPVLQARDDVLAVLARAGTFGYNGVANTLWNVIANIGNEATAELTVYAPGPDEQLLTPRTVHLPGRVRAQLLNGWRNSPREWKPVLLQLPGESVGVIETPVTAAVLTAAADGTAFLPNSQAEALAAWNVTDLFRHDPATNTLTLNQYRATRWVFTVGDTRIALQKNEWWFEPLLVKLSGRASFRLAENTVSFDFSDLSTQWGLPELATLLSVLDGARCSPRARIDDLSAFRYPETAAEFARLLGVLKSGK